jgi:hypothetical protein
LRRSLRTRLFLIHFAWVILSLQLSAGLLHAHGDEAHPAPDSAAAVVIDSSDAIVQFKAALDSLYEEIAESYTSVEPMLKKSCYDCHSDQTNFPWYHSLPIVKQLIDTDITEAQEHLDFSEGFPFGGHATQENQLREIREEVEHGGMPPASYRFMHWGRLIENEKQDTLFQWIDSSLSAIDQVYMIYGVPHSKDTDED